MTLTTHSHISSAEVGNACRRRAVVGLAAGLALAMASVVAVGPGDPAVAAVVGDGGIGSALLDRYEFELAVHEAVQYFLNGSALLDHAEFERAVAAVVG